MYKALNKRFRPAPGFSLVEMLAVIVIFAILAMIAAPAIFSIIPSFQLRRAASATSGLMNLGRVTAYNTKKPARAVINCRLSNEPCRLSLYTAVFDVNGALDSWAEIGNSIRALTNNIEVSAQTPNTMISGNPANVYWAVFLPTGEVIASHRPFTMILDTQGFNTGPWEVSVDLSSGHTASALRH